MMKIELETEDSSGIVLARGVAGFLIFALIEKKGSEMQKSEIHCTVYKMYQERRVEYPANRTYYWLVADTQDKTQQLKFEISKSNYETTSANEDIVVYKYERSGAYTGANYDQYEFKGQDITKSITFSALNVEEKTAK